MSIDVIVTGIIGIIASIISGLVTFFQTKKKYNTEVESQQIQNMNDAFDLYKKAMEELMEVKDKKIEMLQQEVESLREQVKTLQTQIVGIVRMMNVTDKMMPPELRSIEDNSD